MPGQVEPSILRGLATGERMAIEDDDKPRKKVTHEIGQDLSLLSVEELTERIALMTSEIERLHLRFSGRSPTRANRSTLRLWRFTDSRKVVSPRTGASLFEANGSISRNQRVYAKLADRTTTSAQIKEGRDRVPPAPAIWRHRSADRPRAARSRRGSASDTASPVK